ncbi:MAG: DHH family phosphoesterase [Candidatus Eisenbacteria bacterium]
MASQPARKVKELCEFLSPSDRVLVLMKPDPDALSSAWALKRLLTGRVQTCQVAHVGEIVRLENKAMVRILRIRSERLDKVDLSTFTKFALVDGQPDQFGEMTLPRFDIVIDHHPVVTAFDAPYQDLRPEEGATATILTEYLQRAKARIPKALATALCFGIKTDTNGLTRGASPRDVKAYAFLLPKAHLTHLRQIEQERVSRTDLDLLARAIGKVEMRRKFLFVFLEGPVPPDSLVILADTFVGVAGASVVAVAGTYRSRAVVILRGKGPRVDVGRIARSAFGEFGNAGGHQVAARAEVLLSRLPEGVAGDDPEGIGAWAKKQIQGNLSSRKKKTP